MLSKRKKRKTRVVLCSSFLVLLLVSLVLAACSNPNQKVLNHFSDFAVPNGYDVYALTAGPDGNVWFTGNDGNKIGKITSSGIITEFPIAGGPNGITACPDGNLWFTEHETHMIRE